MRRVRPSPAMAIASLALFVTLSGTALAASYVVSSNSQVAPNTISGHKPPTGAHANVIGGSLNALDLAPGAVTLGKLGANSVNSAKVVNGSLTDTDADTSSLQRRITGACPSGQAATSVSEAGVLDCATPNARSVDALYGDGSDGDVTINVNTTLTRDTYYDDLTVEPGKTLNPGGYRIFVSGTLTLGDGAAIARDGANGADCCPMLFPGTLGHSGAGGLFVGGDSVNSSLGGSGGAGGSVAGFPGKSGGFATPPPAEAGGAQVFRQALSALSGRTLEGPLVNGGAGGGAGALILAGGGGGGVVVVITATAKPAAMTLSAAGGSGAQPGNPGFTAWLN